MKTPHFGDIIFFKPQSFKGRLITLIDRGQWSHVALVLDIYENRVLFIESYWYGVRSGILNEKRKNFEIRTPDKKIQKTKKEILGFVGKKYDYKHLFFMGLHIGTNKLIPLPSTDEEKFICSELVNWAYNYTLSPKGKSTPNSIYTELKRIDNISKTG